ncbi:uncharacterized protein si:ch211-127m7.2 [Syngnathus scovelli]|uniref:uncharacterized protein si:ch211-127m7.2 n=1 Tax=Syngnathus scovelli TaxID=161590 RepID=UPI002110A0D6|nr:uncharacterized protein si:ch211-127m7.2 [Syngnathus scovelli]
MDDNDGNMLERRRALPLWMSKKDNRGKDKQSLKTTRKKKAARAVHYCMNEKELLEAAIAYLGDQHITSLSDQQVQSKLKDAAGKSDSPTKKTGKLVSLEEGKPPCQETCVSETDLDVAEMETIPYTRSTHEEEEEEDTKQQTEKTERQHLTENQGSDDDMRLVREIFFT